MFYIQKSVSGSSLAALEKLSKAFRRPDLHIEKLASSCIDKQKDLKSLFKNVMLYKIIYYSDQCGPITKSIWSAIHLWATTSNL